MKKTILLLAIFTIALFGCNAQNAGKYAHINSQEILKAMPGIDSISIKLAAFQKDMETIYSEMVADYQKKKEKFDMEAGTMSASVRKFKEDELAQLEQSIQEFSYNAQGDIEEEQYKLLTPFQDKLKKAIDEVAQDNKYTYIFDTATLLYSDGGEDISHLIKAKLGIK